MTSKRRLRPASISFTSTPNCGWHGGVVWKRPLRKIHERLSPISSCPPRKNPSRRLFWPDCAYSITKRKQWRANVASANAEGHRCCVRGLAADRLEANKLHRVRRSFYESGSYPARCTYDLRSKDRSRRSERLLPRG